MGRRAAGRGKLDEQGNSALNGELLYTLPETLQDWTGAVVLAAIAVIAGWLLHFAVHGMLRRIAHRSEIVADNIMVRHLRHPARWTLVAFAIAMAAQYQYHLNWLWGWFEPFLVPALIGWIAVELVGAIAELLEHQAADGRDADVQRSRKTRIAILARIAVFLIIFVTVALMLIAVPGVSKVGVTLMASAGLVTLAVGAAAQPVLKSLIAGIQIALTEPMRIGDYVVIEGESGRVEDIHLSYVVLRAGDERRLIVPTAKFLDATFQNWTRTGGGIAGHVLLPVATGTAVEPIRAKFLATLAAHPDWDKRHGALQVADARVGSNELRLVLSAKDPDAIGRLRLDIREAMVEWLRAELPEALCKEP
jgi:small-conductance mechanosensitive channel